jgi:L-asparaginase / beta-aspartyl-peptidase
MPTAPGTAQRAPCIVVHGGAWAIPDALTERSLAGVRRACEAGYAVLRGGGAAVDAVVAAVVVLEDDPAFDAGRGSCLNARREVEMDAVVITEDPAIEQSLRSGAVAAVSRVKNPVKLAMHVMDSTKHCLLVGPNADEFAIAANAGNPGIQLVDSAEEMVSPEAIKEWEEFAKYSDAVETLFNNSAEMPEQSGHDTVGAVALDCCGRLAAATSTGGITMKVAGRVGDSPIVGSGAYVSVESGAVSTTGHGESIMNCVLAKHALQVFEMCPDKSVSEVASSSLDYMQRKTGGRGGIIIVSKDGQIAHKFSTSRMVWASISSAQGGVLKSGIDSDDQE